MKILKVAMMIAAVVGIAGTAQAADGGDGKVAIGLQGGLNFPMNSYTKGTGGVNFDDKSGWLGGVYGEFGVWSVTLRPEVNYVSRNFKVGNLIEVDNRYIEIPLLVKFNPFGSAPFSPFILLGPKWSTQVSTEVKTAIGSASYTNTADDWDIAGVAGLGFEFNVSENIALGVQGRYNLGFRDIDTSANEIKLRSFDVLAGLTFQGAF